MNAGPLPASAVDAHRAARLARKPVDLGKAESGPLSYVLGGEERLKQERQDFRAHAYACVAYGEAHEIAGEARFVMEASDVLAADLNRTAVRHGIARVYRQVQHDQLKLRRIDLDRPELLRK